MHHMCIRLYVYVSPLKLRTSSIQMGLHVADHKMLSFLSTKYSADILPIEDVQYEHYYDWVATGSY